MTELVFILDRSGSMSGLERDTIGGFNSMIEKQKQESRTRIAEKVIDNMTQPPQIVAPGVSNNI